MLPRLAASGRALFATNVVDPEAYLCIGMPLFFEFIAGQDEFGAEAAGALEQEQRELGEPGELVAH